MRVIKSDRFSAPTAAGITARPKPQGRAAVVLAGRDAETLAPLAKALRARGHFALTAGSLAELEHLLAVGRTSIVVADVDLTESPATVIGWIAERAPGAPVLLLAGGDQRTAAVDGLRAGAYAYATKPLDLDEVSLLLTRALSESRLSQQLADCQLAREQLEAETRRRDRGVASRLALALQYRQGETACHMARIGLYSSTLGAVLGWGQEDIDDLRVAASVHDIGTIGIPERILAKPGSLTKSELDLVRRHTRIGADILGRADTPIMDLAREVALCHHERWDGNGYPLGLEGDEIPLGARIVAVADVYDVLVHGRVYFPPTSEDYALDYLERGRETQFDPEVLDAFFSVLPQIQGIRAALVDAPLPAPPPVQRQKRPALRLV